MLFSNSLRMIKTDRDIPESLPTKAVNGVVLCTVCMQTCTVPLPSGVNSTAVNKYQYIYIYIYIYISKSELRNVLCKECNCNIGDFVGFVV